MIKSRVLYELFYNFTDTVISPNYHSYIGTVLNDSTRVYRGYMIFGTSRYFVEITKILKRLFKYSSTILIILCIQCERI